MSSAIVVAWIALAAIHLMPALGLVSPAIRQVLYGIEPAGALATLLSHRAILFAALVLASLGAAAIPALRPGTAIAVTTSVIGYLVAYAANATPAGPLRKVALVDGIALAPLTVVWIDIARG